MVKYKSLWLLVSIVIALVGCCSVSLSEKGQDKNVEIPVTDRELLFQDVQWGLSVEEYCKALEDKGVIGPMYSYDSWDYVSLYPTDETVTDEYIDNNGIIDMYRSKSWGKSPSLTLPKKYGGIEVYTNSLSYLFSADKNGQPDLNETHVYSVSIYYRRDTDGSDLLKALEDKYGKPYAELGKSLHVYIWKGLDTRIVYFLNQGKAYTLWYINTKLSDQIKERINSYEDRVDTV